MIEISLRVVTLKYVPSLVKLESQLKINMRVSQYRVQTSSWVLSDLQGPTGAVRSGGAQRRRRLTAKVTLRMN